MARGHRQAFVGAHQVLANLAPVTLAVHHGETLHGNGGEAERVSEARRDLLEFHDAIGVGRFVDAVERRQIQVLDMRGDGFVGRQHELFDDAVRHVARRFPDGRHLAGFVEIDDGFRQIEIDGAAALTPLVENPRQFFH